MTFLKSLVVCLALANIGYFLWIQGIASPPGVPAAAGTGQTLQLVSEVAAHGRTAPGGTEAGGANPAEAESDRPERAVDAADVAGGASGAAAVGTQPGAGPTAGAPTVGAPSTAASASGAPVSASAAPFRRCVTVGPVKDVSEAAHAASTLRSGGYDPRQRVVDGDVWAGVWVYLPMPATHPASDQLLAKLKAAGIDDSLLMPGPGDVSVVSLGLFSEQKRAQARVAQVQALGLTPGVADRRRPGNLYWIDLDLKPGDGALNPSDLQGEAGHISRLEVKACAAPATAPASTPAPAASALPAAPGANQGSPS